MKKKNYKKKPNLNDIFFVGSLNELHSKSQQPAFTLIFIAESKPVFSLFWCIQNFSFYFILFHHFTVISPKNTVHKFITFYNSFLLLFKTLEYSYGNDFFYWNTLTRTRAENSALQFFPPLYCIFDAWPNETFEKIHTKKRRKPKFGQYYISMEML